MSQLQSFHSTVVSSGIVPLMHLVEPFSGIYPLSNLLSIPSQSLEHSPSATTLHPHMEQIFISHPLHSRRNNCFQMTARHSLISHAQCHLDLITKQTGKFQSLEQLMSVRVYRAVMRVGVTATLLMRHPPLPPPRVSTMNSLMPKLLMLLLLALLLLDVLKRIRAVISVMQCMQQTPTHQQ